MVLIYQVLTKQCLKKVFLISNDFVPNDSSLLNRRTFTRGYAETLMYDRSCDKSGISITDSVAIEDRDLVVSD